MGFFQQGKHNCLEFHPQDDLVPKARGQRNREALSGCEGNAPKCCLLYAQPQGRWWPGVGIQSQLVRGARLRGVNQQQN